jgi:hypothetical protein
MWPTIAKALAYCTTELIMAEKVLWYRPLCIGNCNICAQQKISFMIKEETIQNSAKTHKSSSENLSNFNAKFWWGRESSEQTRDEYYRGWTKANLGPQHFSVSAWRELSSPLRLSRFFTLAKFRAIMPAINADNSDARQSPLYLPWPP